MGREYAVAVARRDKNQFDIREMQFSVLKNGLNYWVADPFPIEVDGVLYIFGEVFEYSKLKGSIGYTRLENGSFTPWKIVINERYHMSFPYLFYRDNNLYMCPEACESRRLYLYRCVCFPEKWERAEILAENVNFSDTIFLKREQNVFGFTCEWNGIEDHRFHMFKLENGRCVLSYETLETLSYYLTRPAGRIFVEPNSTDEIMVSQICKPQYGSGLIFKKFTLNWPDYSERELYRVYPGDIKCDIYRDYIGLHTLNYTDNYAVIDLIWNRFSIVEKIYRGLNKIKNNLDI